VTQRKHDQWKVANPIRLDGAGNEVPRPCDLIICPECLAVRYIGSAQLETRSPGIIDKDVTGVFCPGCDQLLFDEAAWVEHRAEQKQYDNEVRRRKEGERNQRSDPLGVAAAEHVEPEAADDFNEDLAENHV